MPAVVIGAPSAKKDEAAAISQIAMTKAKAGDYKLCAELYHQAYRTDPAFLGYLYSAARCAQKGGNLDAAERDFRALLRRAPADHELAPRAQKHIEEVLKTRAEAPPIAEPPKGTAGKGDAGKGDAGKGDAGKGRAGQGAPSGKGAAAGGTGPGVVKKAEPLPKPATWKRPTGLAGLVAGGLAVAVGGWLLVDGSMARADLVERLDNRKDGLVVGMTPAEARADEEDYQSSLRLGAIAAGGGLVLAGVGGWLLATAPQKKVSLLPTTNGVALVIGWR